MYKVGETLQEEGRLVDLFSTSLDIKILDFMIIHRFGYSIINEKIGSIKIDHDLTSGLISAIVLASKELFNAGKGIKVLDFGENSIILNSGDYLILGVVTEFITSDLKKYLKDILCYFEEKYAELLSKWSGNLDEIKSLTEAISKALSPYIIKELEFKEAFDEDFITEDMLFNIKDLNKITIQNIAEINCKVYERNLSEGKIFSLCRLINHDALSFNELKCLLNLDELPLKRLLFSVYRLGKLRIFKRADIKKLVNINTQIKIASPEDYSIIVSRIEGLQETTGVNFKLSFSEHLQKDSAVIFPVIIAMVRSGEVIIPYIMKNVEKLRVLLEKDILKEAAGRVSKKDMNLLSAIKKIDKLW